MSDNKDKKDKKPFYKQWWFWIIIIVAATINIVFASVYGTQAPNIFTAISGWVSGVATVALGIIALVQNERYEKDNEHYINEQKNIQQNIANENIKQNEFNQRQADYNELKQYYDSVSESLFEFFSENICYSFKCQILKCHEHFDENSIIALQEFGTYIETQRMTIRMLIMKIRLHRYSNNYRNELVKNLHDIENIYYDFRKYGTQAGNWEYVIENLNKDTDMFFNVEIKAIELMKSFLIEQQRILDYVYDKSVSYNEYNELLTTLNDKRKQDEEELNNWIKSKVVEEAENGQDENGN